MDKEFLEWWELHKFELMQSDEAGLREIAYAGWQAGRGGDRPEPRIEWKNNKVVIGSYKCGCSYGPVKVGSRLEYCEKHGGDIQSEYEVTTHSGGM